MVRVSRSRHVAAGPPSDKSKVGEAIADLAHIPIIIVRIPLAIDHILSVVRASAGRGHLRRALAR
jgi:hypothetical protein